MERLTTDEIEGICAFSGPASNRELSTCARDSLCSQFHALQVDQLRGMAVFLQPEWQDDKVQVLCGLCADMHRQERPQGQQRCSHRFTPPPPPTHPPTTPLLSIHPIAVDCLNLLQWLSILRCPVRFLLCASDLCHPCNPCSWHYS